MDEITGRYPDVTGFILAGGQSKRLGRDKRNLVVRGVTLLQRTERLLNKLLGSESYVVGDNLSHLKLAQARVVHDAYPGCGPLGGLVALLEYCSTNRCLVLAVDMPLLQKADLQRLLDEDGDGYDVIALSAEGKPEPLAALYRKSTALFWRERLLQRRLSIRDGIKCLNWKAVMLEENGLSLRNINEPKDIGLIDY